VVEGNYLKPEKEYRKAFLNILNQEIFSYK
jgi:hypothetical protein